MALVAEVVRILYRHWASHVRAHVTYTFSICCTYFFYRNTIFAAKYYFAKQSWIIGSLHRLQGGMGDSTQWYTKRGWKGGFHPMIYKKRVEWGIPPNDIQKDMITNLDCIDVIRFIARRTKLLDSDWFRGVQSLSYSVNQGAGGVIKPLHLEKPFHYENGYQVTLII